jgi:hypothetical protein
MPSCQQKQLLFWHRISATAAERPAQVLFLVTPSEQPIWPAQTIPTQITPPSSDAKAEGIAVLRESGRKLSILVLFENAERDKPVEHTIQLP